MKKIVLILLLVAMLAVLCSCAIGNRQIGIDTVQSFNRAYIYLNGEWKSISVSSWRDFDDSDVIQVSSGDKIYLTHYMNVVLVRDTTK